MTHRSSSFPIAALARPTRSLSRAALHDKPIATAEAERSAWSNLRDALRRIDSMRCPARAGIHFDDQEWETVADSEGYFTHELPLAAPVAKTDAWHAVHLHLLEPALASRSLCRGAGVVPPPTARYGVISDIDDTILRRTPPACCVRRWSRCWRTPPRARPSRRRCALSGALQAGANGNGRNPIFYVSSSPWNLYDFLVEFMEINGIPAGPIFCATTG